MRAPVAVGWALAAAIGSSAGGLAGCESAGSGCVVGTEACRCTASDGCETGLGCKAGRCVRGQVNPTQERPDGGAPVAVSGMIGAAPPLTVPAQPGAAVLPDPPPPDQGAPVTLKGPRPVGERIGLPPTWTILVYGHGDHNLSPALLTDFGEMNRAELSDNVRVVLLSDWNAAARIPSSSADETFPAGAFWHQIAGGGNKALSVGAENELDLDNPAVLAKVIELGFRAYPADRHGLILWDHGGSWFGGFGGDTDNDTHDPHPMTVAALAGAVKRGLSAAGLGGSRPLDFLGFDTCVMAGAEVIASFRETAKLFIGNAELDYGDGFDYEATLTWLSANPGASIAELARAEARAWDEHHREASAEDYLFRSHAAFDTVKFEEFMSASRALVTAARTSRPAAVARSFYGTVPGYFSGETGASEAPRLRDVGNILERMGKFADPPLAAAATRALEAARAAKLAGSAGTTRVEQLGMHVFAGPMAALTDQQISVYPRYVEPWTTGSGWADLLAGTRAARSMEKPELKGEAVVPSVPSLQEPPSVNVQIAGNDLGSLGATLVQQNPADPMQLEVNGDIDAALVSAGGGFTIRWSGKRHMIDTSPEPLLVTAQPWVATLQGQKLVVTFYGIEGLLVVGQEYFAVTLLTTPEGVAGAVVLKDPMAVLTFDEVADAAEGQAMFVPLVRTWDGRKNEFEDVPSRTGVYLPKEGALRVIQQPVPAGNYAVLVDVEDVWGNYNLEFYDISLPQGLR